MAQPQTVTPAELDAREENYRRKFLFDLNDLIISPSGIMYVVIGMHERNTSEGKQNMYIMSGYRRRLVLPIRFLTEELLSKWVKEQYIAVAEVGPDRGGDMPLAVPALRL